MTRYEANPEFVGWAPLISIAVSALVAAFNLVLFVWHVVDGNIPQACVALVQATVCVGLAVMVWRD